MTWDTSASAAESGAISAAVTPEAAAHSQMSQRPPRRSKRARFSETASSPRPKASRRQPEPAESAKAKSTKSESTQSAVTSASMRSVTPNTLVFRTRAKKG